MIALALEKDRGTQRNKRLLLMHGYPPDQEPTATDLILHQAEVTAEVGE
jgi:hypothetical protein